MEWAFSAGVVAGRVGLAFTSRAWEWAGGVAMFGKAKNVLAQSGCGCGIYYTGNRDPVIKGTEAEG